MKRKKRRKNTFLYMDYTKKKFFDKKIFIEI